MGDRTALVLVMAVAGAIWILRFDISLFLLAWELGLSRETRGRKREQRVTLVREELDLRYTNLCWGIRSMTARMGRLRDTEGEERIIYEAIDYLSREIPTSNLCEIIERHLDTWIFFGRAFGETQAFRREIRFLRENFQFMEKLSVRYPQEHSSAS